MTYFRNHSGSINKSPLGGEGYNDTGSQINKATPIAINPVDGGIELVDVSSEDSARSSFAVVRETTADEQPLEYISSGRIENVSLAFDYGDTVYVSKIGGLTNIPPSVGVGGFQSLDFIIRVGLIAKNLSNPAQKDLVVDMELEGQLE